jgi:hypothetical protein
VKKQINETRVKKQRKVKRHKYRENVINSRIIEKNSK